MQCDNWYCFCLINCVQYLFFLETRTQIHLLFHTAQGLRASVQEGRLLSEAWVREGRLLSHLHHAGNIVINQGSPSRYTLLSSWNSELTYSNQNDIMRLFKCPRSLDTNMEIYIAISTNVTKHTHFILRVSYQIRKIEGWACARNAGNVSPPLRVNNPDIYHGTCVTHVPWCLPGSLTSGFLRNRWRGKRSRHSRRMGNPQLCVSGKRPVKATPCGNHCYRLMRYISNLVRCSSSQANGHGDDKQELHLRSVCSP